MSKQFEPFLKALKTGQPAPPEMAPEGGEPAPPPTAERTVLRALVGVETLTLQEVQSATGLGFVEFADAVRALQDAGLVEMSGPSGGEEIRLSRMGEAVAPDRP